MQLEIESEEQSNAVENLKRPCMADVEAGRFVSLLEEILRAAAAAGDFDRHLLDLLDRIKRAMELFWQDPAINFPLIAKKDISHNRRLLFYIEKLLFPESRRHENAVGEELTVTFAPLYHNELDLYDVFVLLCAVYLHDYGKGQYLLAAAALPKDLADKMRSMAGATQLTWEIYGLVEQYHSKTISDLFQVFLDEPTDCTELVRLLTKKYDKSFAKHIECVAMARPQSPPRDGADAQKQLFWIFWQLCQARHGHGGRRLLEEIQLVCRAHKSATILEPGGVREIDFFAQIFPADRTRLLAALLRTGDNLDLTRARLAPGGILMEQFRNWIQEGAPAGAYSAEHQRLFGKWVTFAAVERVEIRHIDLGEAGIRVEIILGYNRFGNWQRHLFTIRKLVEKDFNVSHYLGALERNNPDEHIELRLHYEIQAADDAGSDFQLAISGALEDAFSALRSRPAATPEQPYSLIRPEETTPPSTLRFSPLPDGLELPTNQALLYLIASLDTFGRTACDRIARQIGLREAEDLPGKAESVNRGMLLKVAHGDKLVELAEGAPERVRGLLRAFREHPALLRQKVREIEEFGHLLPFSVLEVGSIPTGVDGLAKILDPFERQAKGAVGFQRARNILVVGGPGSGKTTLLVQILHHNLLHAQRNVLMLTFEELTPMLAAAYHDHFGWQAAFVRNIHLDPNQEPDDFLANFHLTIRAEEPDLVAIDGLSRLRWVFRDNYRDVVDGLFKSLQVRGISSICSIEEPHGQGPGEEYQADGVVHLSRRGEGRQLWIEKLRGQNYIAGKHAFEILDGAAIRKGLDRLTAADRPEYPFQPGINVYPNEQYYAAVADSSQPSEQEDPEGLEDLENPKYIPTGVKNLDLLLPGREPNEGGYRRGETVLVLGSPGAGKTLFGLHFLKAAFDSVGYAHSPRHRVLWLSFEGPSQLLGRSVASFDKEVGFAGLLRRPEFLFEFVPPALISPEKVFYHVTELVRRFDIRRIVIDSVSEIEEAFAGEKARFRQYMTTFILTLARQNVSSMFLYRVAGFFRTAGESESDIATLVDTIISIKTFDMKNKIRRGLFVLKSRGRELRSQLQTMDIHMKHGIQLSYKGWEMEGLLSGETGNIYEPEIFLKHFYENPAESEVNEEIAREFHRRYPKGRFTVVRKSAIHSEFWSFRGHYGAGHANIRVISISRYMVQAFRERDSLHALEDLFPEKLQEQIRRDERWSRYVTEAGGYDSIPMYTDMGFLVARRDLAGQLLDHLRAAGRPEPPALSDAGGAVRFQDVRWEDLKSLAAEVSDLKLDRPFVFALPYLYDKTEFMAFFFELLWSKGGDVYHFPIWDRSREPGRDAFYKKQIFLNQHLWRVLRRIIGEAKSGSRAVYDLEEMRKRLGLFLDVMQPGDASAGGEEGAPPVEDRFVEWINARVLGNPLFSIDNDDVLTIDNRYGYEALEHLYDLVFDARSAIPNPYDGEFRSESVFSRHWYSQIQGLRDKVQAPSGVATPEAIEVLPLPSFTADEGERRRSCTCETVWCLSLVREALSPEIGWIFIDTLTSKGWIEKRFKLRCGFPYNLEEIKSMERFDLPAYSIAQAIVDNKRSKDRIYDAQQKLIAPLAPEEERAKTEAAADDFLGGRFHQRDIGDVLDYFLRHPGFEERRKIFEERIGTKGRQVEVHQGRVEGRISELSDFEDFGEDTALRSKLPDHRPMFHRVESILHDEIVSLFSPQGRRDWYSALTGETFAGKSDEDIDAALAQKRAAERETRSREARPGPIERALERVGKKEKETERRGLIERALGRIHDRVVFDLLVSTPGELQQLLQKQVAKR